MTKGVKSSEFWLTIAGLGVGAWLHTQGADATVVLAFIGAGPAYGLGRGIAKHGNSS